MRLFFIHARRGEARSLDLSWFSAENYDLGYQGLMDSLAIPNCGLVAVSVQRSSKLVLLDIETNTRVGTITLAGRNGNPTLVPLSQTEIVASDYDSLCIVDAHTGEVRHSQPLQVASGP